MAAPGSGRAPPWTAPCPEGYRFTGDTQGAHRARAPESSILDTGGQGPMDTKRNRVLVVDDEPSIVDAVATSLRYEGFEVEEAMTGRAALSAAQERPPDL